MLLERYRHTRAREQFEVVGEGGRVASVLELPEELLVRDDLRREFIASYDQERRNKSADLELVEVFLVGVTAVLFQRWLRNAPQRLSWLPEFVQGPCQK